MTLLPKEVVLRGAVVLVDGALLKDSKHRGEDLEDHEVLQEVLPEAAPSKVALVGLVVVQEEDLVPPEVEGEHQGGPVVEEIEAVVEEETDLSETTETRR